MTIVYLAHVTELWLVDHTKVDISLYKNKKVINVLTVEIN